MTLPTTKGRPYTGIACPSCRSSDSFVIDSRNCDDKQARRRRHQCADCLLRYTTYEIFAVEYDKLRALETNQHQISRVITKLQSLIGSNNGSCKD